MSYAPLRILDTMGMLSSIPVLNRVMAPFIAPFVPFVVFLNFISWKIEGSVNRGGDCEGEIWHR